MMIKVDRTRCEGNALCVDAAPEVFRLDDDDSLVPVGSGRTGTLDSPTRGAVEDALAVCPRVALVLEHTR